MLEEKKKQPHSFLDPFSTNSLLFLFYYIEKNKNKALDIQNVYPAGTKWVDKHAWIVLDKYLIYRGDWCQFLSIAGTFQL